MTGEEGSTTAADTEWFVRDRFGLFIHWGLYALAARHEWVKNREQITDADYQRYFDHFYPDLYDPRAWADEAWNAGMRYFVVTTKHHEGFCLWDSALTGYKATATPWGQDVLRPMVEAFRERGFKVGFYHSLIDWHHPEFPIDSLHPQRDDEEFKQREASRDIRKYAEYLHGQVRELLTRYGRVDVMWFDFSYPGRGWGGKGRDDWQSETLLKMVRELQPGILVNNRLDIPGDFTTPEQVQPHSAPTQDGRALLWEACQTFNGSWGYDRDNLDWKSPGLLVRMLIDSVSKGGNLLLNVGPTGRGEFEPRAVERLRAIGAWTRQHGRAIYGCGASEHQAPPDCRYTQNGNRLYVHVLAWPFRHLHLPGLGRRVEYAQFLHDASEVRFARAGEREPERHLRGLPEDTITLQLPVQPPEVLVPVIELFLRD